MGLTEERSNKTAGLTALSEAGLTEYHPILNWLIDPVKRDKLERVCQSLKHRNLQSKVSLGIGVNSLPMDVVGGLLEATTH